MVRYVLLIAVLIAGILVILPEDVSAQTKAKRGSANGPGLPNMDPDIPEIALQSNEGLQLAAELKQLQRSLATLGKNHPSVASVGAQIEVVKRRLSALAKAKENGDVGGSAMPQSPAKEISELQMREIIAQMATKIEQLESRLQRLERLMTIE